GLEGRADEAAGCRRRGVHPFARRADDTCPGPNVIAAMAGPRSHREAVMPAPRTPRGGKRFLVPDGSEISMPSGAFTFSQQAETPYHDRFACEISSPESFLLDIGRCRCARLWRMRRRHTAAAI